MSDEQDEDYELVMPFMCVESVGGPYDDNSFVAGFQLGQLEHIFETASELPDGCEPETPIIIYATLKEQVDLLGMKYGLLVEEISWEEADIDQLESVFDDWICVKVRKGTPID